MLFADLKGSMEMRADREPDDLDHGARTPRALPSRSATEHLRLCQIRRPLVNPSGMAAKVVPFVETESAPSGRRDHSMSDTPPQHRLRFVARSLGGFELDDQ